MKKCSKILVVVLCLSLILAIVPLGTFTVGATSITADEAIRWVKSQLGKGVGYDDGSGEYQCVELIQAYYVFLGASTPHGNGCDYATNAYPNGWSRVQGGQPQKGDILVYTGGYGHVAIYESDYSTYHQNYNRHPYVEQVTNLKYNSPAMGVTYWGYIRPNFASAQTLFGFDVNVSLDGVSLDTGHQYISFDVIINGTKVANDVKDYAELITSGATYTVNDIKVSGGYYLSEKDSFSGTLNADTTILIKTVKPVLKKTETFNNNTYEFYSGSISWENANKYANDLGGHLATVTSKEENDFICNNAGRASWLGATDKEKEGTWKWVTGEKFEYKNWASGQPDNASSIEHYLTLYTDKTWNDLSNYYSGAKGFVVEFEHTNHAWYIVEQKSATCTEDGLISYKCSGCEETKTETLPATGHDYAESEIIYSCKEYAKIKYVCPKCNDSYEITKTAESDFSNWGETKFENVDENAYKTKTQYRCKKKSTIESDQSSVSGYTPDGYTDWQVSKTGTKDYVDSWPQYFDKNHALYSKYNISVKNSETETTKRIFAASSTTAGYIYWHWCCSSYDGSYLNRLVEDHSGYSAADNRTYDTFHAFFTSTLIGNINSDGSSYYEKTDVCKGSGWWNPYGKNIQVKRISYTDYTRKYIHYKWSEFSEWQDEEIIADENTAVETRTLYSYDLSVKISHSYSNNWSSDGTQHWHECSTCGDKTDIEDHIYDNDCDTTCNVCNYIRSVGPHIYDNDCDTTCNVCGATRAITHQYKTVWSSDATQHWHECSVCGDKSDINNHIYDNDSDADCNVCGSIREITVIKDDCPQISVESKTSFVGKTVTLDVKIKNNPSFTALNIALLYDKNNLTLKGIENGITGFMMTSDSSIVWDGGNNFTSDGTIATLTFEIGENAEAKDYEIKVRFFDASNYDGETVEFEAVSGILKVLDIVYGDANGDGNVSTADLTLMRRYFASRDPESGEFTMSVSGGADANGDGKISTADLTALRRYFASRDPETGIPTYLLGPKED